MLRGNQVQQEQLNHKEVHGITGRNKAASAAAAGGLDAGHDTGKGGPAFTSSTFNPTIYQQRVLVLSHYTRKPTGYNK